MWINTAVGDMRRQQNSNKAAERMSYFLAVNIKSVLNVIIQHSSSSHKTL